jgi:hypothetical protein
MTVFKLRSVRRGGHVHTTVFSGEEGGTLANVGMLVQNIGEWQEFGALLWLGSRRTVGRIGVVFEGDEKIVSEEVE